MGGMETSQVDECSPKLSRRLIPSPRLPIEFFPLIVAVALLLTAAVAQFVFGPTTSPGFSYLAVVFALAGIGALLAAGLET